MARHEGLYVEVSERLGSRADKAGFWSAIGTACFSLILVVAALMAPKEEIQPPAKLLYTNGLQEALNRKAEEVGDSDMTRRIIRSAEARDLKALLRAINEAGLQRNYGAQLLLAQVGLDTPGGKNMVDYAAVLQSPEAANLDNPRLLAVLERAAFGAAMSAQAKEFEKKYSEEVRVQKHFGIFLRSFAAFGLFCAMCCAVVGASLRRRQRKLLALLSVLQPKS